MPENNAENDNNPPNTMIETAYLVDLVSNHKIKIPVPLCKIGRDEINDIVVSGDQSISRHHLSLFHEDGRYYMLDNESRHGTFLNGTQTKTKEVINDGDVIKIGVSLFWFVVEAGTPEQEGPSESANFAAGLSKTNGGESVHLNLRSEHQAQSTDPASSTMNEIPVIANEQTLLERLRLKTHSFDEPGLFTSTQLPPSPISTPSSTASVNSLANTPPIPVMPMVSLDTLLSTSPQELHDFSKPPEENSSSELNMSPPALNSDSNSYDQLLDSDLAELTNKYNHLEAEIESAQRERQAIANQLNAIRALGTSLIGGSESPLIESCYKVFSELGWQISRDANDPQEFQLKFDGKNFIARIIWTAEAPEREHLGQLSISQTRLWCDQGEEPKGILIISLLGNNEHQIPSLTKADYDSELAKYAAKKKRLYDHQRSSSSYLP